MIVRLVPIGSETDGGSTFDTYEFEAAGTEPPATGAGEVPEPDGPTFVEIVTSRGFAAALGTMEKPEVKWVGSGGGKRLQVRCVSSGTGAGEAFEFEVHRSGGEGSA